MLFDVALCVSSQAICKKCTRCVIFKLLARVEVKEMVRRGLDLTITV